MALLKYCMYSYTNILSSVLIFHFFHFCFQNLFLKKSEDIDLPLFSMKEYTEKEIEVWLSMLPNYFYMAEFDMIASQLQKINEYAFAFDSECKM